MIRRAALAGLAFLAACGSGSGSPNTSSGAVKQASFSEPYAIYNIKGQIIIPDKLVVLVSDDPSACDHLAYGSDQERPYLQLPDGSHGASLWMKASNHSNLTTDMRSVGDDLQAIFDPGAPTSDGCSQAACEGRWITAHKGTMEINGSKDPGDADGFADGSYYLTFDGDQISGSFDAKPCKALKAEGCAAVGGSAAPALGALALVLLRRRRA